MVEAAGRVVEVLVGKKVDRDATSRVIYFGDLEKGDAKVRRYVIKIKERKRENRKCYLHATICGVEHFISKPLDRFGGPGSDADGEVCQAALHGLSAR